MEYSSFEEHNDTYNSYGEDYHKYSHSYSMKDANGFTGYRDGHKLDEYYVVYKNMIIEYNISNSVKKMQLGEVYLSHKFEKKDNIDLRYNILTKRIKVSSSYLV